MKSRREMELLLERMAVGRLAVTTEDGPYVVAVNYLFLDGHIYFHSGLAGRKIEALRTDPRVCFLVDDVGPQVLWDKGCGISQIYESVMCFGRVELVDAPAEKKRILDLLIKKYVPADHPFPPMEDAGVEKTAVARIVIESMSGKANRLTPSHTVLPARR